MEVLGVIKIESEIDIVLSLVLTIEKNLVLKNNQWFKMLLLLLQIDKPGSLGNPNFWRQPRPRGYRCNIRQWQ
jgi:hypothetical protein